MLRTRRSAAGSVSVRPGHVHLAEQDHAPALAVLHQRAVLQAVAAVEDRQEIAARRLLDQDRGHVAPVAAPPDPRHVDAAPLHRRGRSAADRVLQARREDRRLAAPVAQVLRVEPGQERVVRQRAERPAAARTPRRGTRTAAPGPPPSARRRSPSARRARGGCPAPAPSARQRALADDEHVVSATDRRPRPRAGTGRPCASSSGPSRPSDRRARSSAFACDGRTAEAAGR